MFFIYEFMSHAKPTLSDELDLVGIAELILVYDNIIHFMPFNVNSFHSFSTVAGIPVNAFLDIFPI